MAYLLEKNVLAFGNDCLSCDTLIEFYHNCAYRVSKINFTNISGYEFYIGKQEKPSLTNGDYVISVSNKGIYVVAKGKKELIHAYVTLLQKIVMQDDGSVAIEDCLIEHNPPIKRQMVFYGIAPETKLYEIERFICTCGALKYTHVVLEFWGSLKLDALKELAWPNAYTKDQIKPIIKKANDFGIEIIPAFPHWGHAASSMISRGKHVVLSQNPSLDNYFTCYGWCWKIESEKVKALLRNVRKELIELCGDGEYFHICCDEAFGYKFESDSMKSFCSYINGISKELNDLGRRAIMWGDMLVYHRKEFNPKNKYDAHSKSLETEKFLLDSLDKQIIIADWQYECPEYPIETSFVFKNAGFDVLVCPWDRGYEKAMACVNTAKDGLYGVMHTTWNTLKDGYPYLLFVANGCQGVKEIDHAHPYCQMAEIIRRAYFTDGDYLKAGWYEKQF